MPLPENQVADAEEKIENLYNPKPKVLSGKVFGAGTANSFTSFNIDEANNDLRFYLSKNITVPRNEVGRVIRSKEELEGMDANMQASYTDGLTQEEIDFLMNDKQNAVKNVMSQGYFNFEKVALDDNELTAFAKRVNSSYKAPKKSAQLIKEERGKLLADKYYEYSVNKALATDVTQAKLPKLDRTEQTLIKPHFDDKTMAENLEMKRILTSGTVQEKQDFYLNFFKDLSTIDVSKIDLMDDQSIVDNFDTIADVMTYTVELTNLLRNAEALGLDFSGEEYKPMFEKLAILKDYGYTARTRIDTMTNPLYSQMDLSQFKITADDCLQGRAGDDIAVRDAFEELLVDKLKYPHAEAQAASFAIGQIAFHNTINKDNPLFNQSIKLGKRFEKYIASDDFKNNELKPIAPKKVELGIEQPSTSELKNRLEMLHDKLKKADNWYNLNNSDEYKNLLSALEQSVDVLSKSDIDLNSKDADVVYQSIANVRKCSEEYIKHVGENAKNEMQEKRLGIVKDIKYLSGKGLDDISNFRDEVAKAYYKGVRGADLADENIAKQEETFKKGLEQTEALRADVEQLEKKEQRTKNEDVLLAVDKSILDARDKLTDLVGREELDLNTIRPLIGRVMMGNLAKDKLATKLSNPAQVDKMVDDVVSSYAFEQITKNFTSDDINNFLTKSGETKLLDTYSTARVNLVEEEKAAQKARAAINEGPEKAKAKSKDDSNVLG